MKPSFDALIERQIREHVHRNRDPFYLYDAAPIRAMCRRFAGLPYPLTSVHFACMANAHPSFLGIVREEGLNIFVNSVQHLRLAISCGFSREQIVYAATAMDEVTFWEVHEAGVLVILDSLQQVSRWKRLFPDSPFGIRCNIGDFVEAKNTRGGYFIGKESRIGMTLEEMLSLSGDRSINGLHVYVGTDICSPEYFAECYEALAGFAQVFSGLDYLDFGGGFGLTDEHGEEFDIERFGAVTASLMTRVSGEVGEADPNEGRTGKDHRGEGRLVRLQGHRHQAARRTSAHRGQRIVGPVPPAAALPRFGTASGDAPAR